MKLTFNPDVWHRPTSASLPNARNLEILTLDLVDDPRQITPYDVYVKFTQLGQVNYISPSYEGGIMYTISMQSTDVIGLRRRCGLEAGETRVSLDLAIEDGDDEPNDDVIANTGDNSNSGDQPPQAHILHILNDDCLREIFESPAFSVWDLTAVASVCRRFRAIARQVFPSKYAASGRTLFLHVELWRIEQCFRIFGPLIKHLDCVTCINGTDVVLRLAIMHSPNIVQLKCCLKYERSIDALRSLMPKLHKLDVYIKNVQHSSLSDPTADCALRVWKIRFDHFYMPQLVELSVMKYPEKRNLPLETYFFAKNPQLNTLKLENANIVGGIDKLFECLPNLRELQVNGEVYLAPESSFGRLQHLTKLVLSNFNDEVIVRVLNALNDAKIALENLDLRKNTNARVGDGVIDAVIRLKSITHITLENPRTGNLLRVARELEHLEDICAYCLDRVGLNNVFVEIRNIVEGAPHLTKLKLHIYPLRMANGSGEMIDARLLTKIDTIRRDRGIKLNVVLRIFDVDLLRLSANEGYTFRSLMDRHEKWLEY